MWKYILKRILLFIPTLLIVALLTFGLSKLAPGDPCNNGEPMGPNVSFEQMERARARCYNNHGWNKPLFYISFTSAAYPKDLYKIENPLRREAATKLIAQYGNWGKVQAYIDNIRMLEKEFSELPRSQSRINRAIEIKRAFSHLYVGYKDLSIKSHLSTLEQSVIPDSLNNSLEDSLLINRMAAPVRNLSDSYAQVLNQTEKSKLYCPMIYWYGLDNQFHDWFSNFIKGDFGITYGTGQSVFERLKKPLGRTLLLSFAAIFFTVLLSIPLGVYAAIKRGTRFDRGLSLSLFMLYSLPVFWIATLLLMFFTTPEYGMKLFPIGWPSYSDQTPFFTRFFTTAWHMVLPVFCLSYGALAFLSRQMRGSMIDVINQNYIRTARAKGLGEKQVIWKHAFRNALFPLITIFAMVLPIAVAGAVIVEVIFNINGMGREALQSMFQGEWPVVYAIMMLGALMTLLGNLLADLLYVWADPRISFSENKHN